MKNTIDEYISFAGNIHGASILLAKEFNTHRIVCFNRKLFHRGIAFRSFQHHIPFLGKTSSIPETLGFDIPFLYRICISISRIRRSVIVSAIGIALYIIPRRYVVATIQHLFYTRVRRNQLPANIKKLLQSGCLIFNTKPVHTGSMVFIPIGFAGITTCLVGIVHILIGLIGGLISPQHLIFFGSICFFYGHRNTIRTTGIGYLLSNLTGCFIQVSNLNRSIDAFTCIQIAKFQSLISLVIYRNGAIAIQRFDLSCSRAIFGCIDNSTYNRHMTAMDFYVIQHETIIYNIIGQLFTSGILVRFISVLVDF